MSFWDYFKAIIAICVVLFAALYVTKFVAKAGNGSFRKSSNIKLLASLPLARDRSVAVVAFGDYAYVLGVTGHHVEKLDKIPLSDIDLKKEEVEPPTFGASFKEELASRLKNFGNNKPGPKL